MGKPGAREFQLQDLIEDWRTETVVKLWGPNYVYGDDALITDSQIARIVACAAAGILFDEEAFRREVRWLFGSDDNHVAAILSL